MSGERTQWGVSYQRNDGPTSADGMRITQDEWSQTLVAEWDTKREAKDYMLFLLSSSRLYRRVRIVRRTVTNWVAAS